MTAPILDRDAWLAQRALGIGGSDAGTIMGANPYCSAVRLWAEKTGRIDPPDLSGKAAVHWGNMLEGVVLEEFASLHPELRVLDWSLDRGEVEALLGDRLIGWVEGRQPMVQHTTFPWMQSTLDGIVCTEPLSRAPINQILPRCRYGVLEAKTGGAQTAEGWVPEPPEQHIAQVHHNMIVAGLDFAFLCGLLGGQTWVEHHEPGDFSLSNIIVAEEREFWRCVTEDRRPPLDDSPDARAAFQELHPSGNGKTVILPPSSIEVHEGLTGLSKQIKALERTKREHQAKLMDWIGPNSYGQMPGGNGRYQIIDVHREPYEVEASDYRYPRHLKD